MRYACKQQDTNTVWDTTYNMCNNDHNHSQYALLSHIG